MLLFHPADEENLEHHEVKVPSMHLDNIDNKLKKLALKKINFLYIPLSILHWWFQDEK